MKKFFGRMAMVCALAAMMVTAGLAGEGGIPDQKDLIKPINKELTFVFIPKVVHPWYDIVRDGAEFAAAEFKQRGITINVKFDAPPVAELSDHMKKIESWIGVRPDGIAVACIDPNGDTPVIDEAIAAGLNVITFDTDAPESKRPLYVGHDRDYEDGYEIADVLAEKLGKKGKIAILSGTLTAPNHVGRVKGFKAGLEKYPDMKVVFERPDNDDLQKAVELTENALQAHSDLAAVFCCNASNPVGAAYAVKSAGLAGKVVIAGTNVLPETYDLIREGTIQICKAQRQWEAGYWSVYYLVAMNQGHTIPAEHQTGSRFLYAKDL